MGRRTVLEVAVALVVGVGMGTGAHLWLGSAGAATAPAAQVAGATVERSGEVPDDLTSVATSSVLRVLVTSCGTSRQASATYVRDGAGRELLLTNRHVVRGAATARVVLPGGATVELAVLGDLVGKDAAVLDARPLRDTGATAASQGLRVGPGDPVVVAGHPGGSFRLDAALVDDVQRRSAYQGASDVLLVGAAAEGGHSGGALFDPAGAVVGLVAARDPGTGAVVAYRIGELTAATLGPLPDC
jgi:S1-C subfamily serine protease